jgi:MFS family permease
MIRRFCLYGFLKNQRYFEPFIILAFLEKGLSFLDIGILIGFREICTAVLEIPSGAVADIFGRRRSMILSFCAYIASFLVFALASHLYILFIAMLFYALGDAFRTGTHKAMIFEWLRQEDRLDERTQVYGFTRSWSKIGSAISALIAAFLVLMGGNYSLIFWFSIPPYVINLVNFLGYPSSLDGIKTGEASLSRAYSLTRNAFRQATTQPRLRRLFLESMLLEGVFKMAKDYLQPILQALAISLPVLATIPLLGQSIDDTQRSALIIGIVFFLYFLLTSWASRNAHKAAQLLGGDEKLVQRLWQINLLVFVMIALAMRWDSAPVAVVGFVALGVVQNLFRPAHISRFDRCSRSEMGATILSIESQAKSLAAAIFAPLAGWFVDMQASGNPGNLINYEAVAITGILASLVIVIYNCFLPSFD